jgi:hypothetical protein
VHRAVIAALALAGCGRLQFEAREDGGGSGGESACAPIGHDEDLDGVDDACDLCPQRADSGRDTDRDGIGDDCDLATTAQRRVLFDPFTGPRTEWTYLAGITLANDAMNVDALTGGGGAGAVLVKPPARETFEIAGQIVDGDPQMRQVAMLITDSPKSYYCELYDNGTLALQLTYTPDGTTYVQLATMDLGGRFDTSRFRLIVDHTPPTISCIADWKAVRATVSGAIPMDIAPLQIGVGVSGVRVAIESFVRLETP